MTASYSVTIKSLGRPPTLNRCLGMGKRWLGVKQRWREAGRVAARVAHPHLFLDAGVDIEAQVHCADGRRQDVGACAPAVKAVIDGLVDAGWIADDGPKWVRSVTYLPHRDDYEHGLTVTVKSERLVIDCAGAPVKWEGKL